MKGSTMDINNTNTCERCGQSTIEAQVNNDGEVLCCACWSWELVKCPNCGETCEDDTCFECGTKTGI